MRFIANLMDLRADLGSWARARDEEGWPVIAASDHFFAGASWWPHVWVAATHMAAVTSRARVTTTFANNLFRSPIEFAQAAMTLQTVSGGRFEAGLGAGWNREEMEAAGVPYPVARERADRYVEAVKIVRQIFDTGACDFTGDHYDVHLPALEAWGPPPPLVGSVGGQRTIAGAVPHLDRVELKAASPATRGGSLDFAALGSVKRDDLARLVGRVRDIRADVPIGMFVLCGTGDSPMIEGIKAMLGDDALYGGFFGPAEQVAESILALANEGITEPQISPINPSGFEELAPHLLETGT